jgi:hypothetical protein
MLWPNQGIFIFEMMAAVPPLIACFRLDAARLAVSLLISVLASMLARYTYLVPVAILLLIVGFGLALRRSEPEERQRAGSGRFWKSAAILCLLLFIAMSAYAVRLSLAYNWGPPKILKQPLASQLMDRDAAMTETLNQQFPIGTDEAALTSTLSNQGFKKALRPRPQCRQPETKPGWMEYAPCPAGAKEMTYDYEQIDLICGTRHISINWSVDSVGKITRLEATRYLPCL